MPAPRGPHYAPRVVAAVAGAAAAAAQCTQQNKQKAQYVHYDIEPPLDVKAADNITNTLVLVSTKQITMGVYGSNMFHWGNGGGGYTGGISHGLGKQGTNLFSVWDQGDSHANPNHPNCQRHNNDGSGMGTQCKMPYDMVEGGEYSYRMERVGSNASGDFWRSTMTDHGLDQTHIVGEMFFNGSTDGKPGWGAIKSYSVFYEHVGCNPCDLYYSAIAWVGPVVPGRDLTGATWTQNSYDTATCKLNTATACIPGRGCGKPNVHLMSGPGVVRNITEGQKLW